MYGLLVTCWLLVTTEASKKGPSTICIYDLYFGLQNSISLSAYWLSSQMRVEERNMELKKNLKLKKYLWVYWQICSLPSAWEFRQLLYRGTWNRMPRPLQWLISPSCVYMFAHVYTCPYMCTYSLCTWLCTDVLWGPWKILQVKMSATFFVFSLSS